MALTTQHLLFRQIVEMQMDLNEKTVPGWINKGLDWNTAILTEVAEAIDSTDWKWWKHTETDLENLRVEAIDLLHFIVSANIEFMNDKLCFTGTDKIVERMVFVYSTSKASHREEVLFDKSFAFFLKNIALESLKGNSIFALSNLFHLFFKLGMDDKSIYQAYFTKNLLNHYRQERGYNDPNGDYLKIIDGREDNAVFSEVVSQVLSVEAEPLEMNQLKELAFGLMDKLVQAAR